MVMNKYSLWLLASLVSGSIMTATTAAEIKPIWPKPIISTDITTGTLLLSPNETGKFFLICNEYCMFAGEKFGHDTMVGQVIVED